MAASINDKLTSVRGSSNAVVTTVSSTRAIGGTSLSCVALTGWPTDTAVHFITYKKTAAGLIDKTTQCDWKGIVSGTTIGTLTLKSGTDAGNAVGDFVEMAPTASWGQDAMSALQAQHNQDGTHGAITSTGATLTMPKLVTSINDSNGNEIISTPATTSAVNDITVTNAATGSNPTISATGDDTNIHLSLTGKGTGGVLTKNPYKFSYYANATSSLAASAFSKISFQVKEYDTGSNFENVTNFRFTAPIAGFYAFSAAAEVTTGGTETYAISLYKNGSEYKRGNKIAQGSAGTAQYIVSPPPIQLAANDYIEVWMYNGSGGGKTVSAGQNLTYFGGFLVSAT